MAYIVYEGFFNRKKIYDIHLDFDGITIQEDFITWNEISQTAILQMGSGRGKKYFLIIALKDGGYKKFSLQAFQTLWGFQNAIAAHVEYFKNNRLT